MTCISPLLLSSYSSKSGHGDNLANAIHLILLVHFHNINLKNVFQEEPDIKQYLKDNHNLNLDGICTLDSNFNFSRQTNMDTYEENFNDYSHINKMKKRNSQMNFNNIDENLHLNNMFNNNDEICSHNQHIYDIDPYDTYIYMI